MYWTPYGKSYNRRQNEKRCWNCKEEIHWGLLCRDCVRASLIAFAGGIGAALAALLLKRR